MKTLKKVAILSIITPMMVSLTSCDDLFDPAPENHKDMTQLEDMPSWAVGLLGHAYLSNPLGNGGEDYPWTETATDDAVSNDVNNSYRKIATGAWRKDNNPIDQWQRLRASWQYINQFLELSENVKWAKDEVVSELYKVRFQGEAYGMRALYMFYLLQAHAGWSDGGELLGIPVLTESETVNSDFNKPRDSFKACMDLLKADVAKAVEMLPDEYGDINSDNEVPAKYKSMGATLASYNRVFGNHAKNRMSLRAATAVLAKASLMAASPAFAEGSGVTWEQAAQAMGNVLKFLGNDPVSQMDPNGNFWYTDPKALQNLTEGQNTKEWLWRTNAGGSHGIESNNFVPTLFGNGRINPSQNLVDAFPAANGYPITDERSHYDKQNPYANRDPRFEQFIIHNNSQYGGKTIITAVDGTDNNAMNKFDGKSTRTGYYMKKLLCESVNCDPSSTTDQHHMKPLMRYTEFFLGYAEAANEAWGPQGKGSFGFSAYDVIKAIRSRAGISDINDEDGYLESIKNDKEKMRELIRNERRIELCFEGYRFWDLRRWKANLNETVKGMRIENNHYQVVDVEKRDFKDYMYWGPIPYSETLKFDQLVQNKGW